MLAWGLKSEGVEYPKKYGYLIPHQIRSFLVLSVRCSDEEKPGIGRCSAWAGARPKSHLPQKINKCIRHTLARTLIRQDIICPV